MRFFSEVFWQSWETPNIWLIVDAGWSLGVAIGPWQFGVETVGGRFP
jgi:hypothetical protein